MLYIQYGSIRVYLYHSLLPCLPKLNHPVLGGLAAISSAMIDLWASYSVLKFNRTTVTGILATSPDGGPSPPSQDISRRMVGMVGTCARGEKIKPLLQNGMICEASQIPSVNTPKNMIILRAPMTTRQGPTPTSAWLARDLWDVRPHQYIWTIQPDGNNNTVFGF